MSGPSVIEPDTAADTMSRRMLIAWCGFFAILAYSAHFWFSHRFSLYEDDYVTVPKAATDSLGQLSAYVKQQWIDYTHGRPVGWAMWRIIPWIGFRLGNLGTVYFISGAVVAANCVMLFLLVRRAWGDSLAILTGLAYTLCPADTCRQMLVHTNILQVAVFYFMIAAHCCLSDRWWVRWIVTYVFVALILLTYESMLLPLLLVPLMTRTWDRRVILRWIGHGAICMAMVGLATVIRLHLGEGRLVESTGDTTPTLVKMYRACMFEPTQGMPQWIARIPFTLNEAKIWHVVWPMAVGFVAIVTALLTGPTGRREISPRPAWLGLIRPLLIGVAILYGGYAFAITPDHYLLPATYGRMTSVHLAAAVGMAIVVGVIGQAIFLLADRVKFLRPAVAIALAGYFAVLFGFAFIVQAGFVAATAEQRNFWTSVVRQCPDITGDTVIIVEGRPPQNNWFAMVSSWSDPLILPLICTVPSGRPPMAVLFSSAAEWQGQFERWGDQLVWKDWQPGAIGPWRHQPLVGSKTILLRRTDEKLHRVSGDMVINGVTVTFKPPPADTKPAYTAGPVYPLLIRDRYLPPDQQLHPPAGPVLKH
jgi:hypothetical protein